MGGGNPQPRPESNRDLSLWGKKPNLPSHTPPGKGTLEVDELPSYSAGEMCCVKSNIY